MRWLKVVNDQTWRSSNCIVGAAMSQKPTEPINNHGLPADNRARSGGLDGIPESTCASACRLNRKEQVLYIPIPGRPDSRMQDGEVGPGLGAGNGERPELGPPEMNPHARLPGRAQGPRGSCGQWNDIGPGAPQSGLVPPPQRFLCSPEVNYMWLSFGFSFQRSTCIPCSIGLKYCQQSGQSHTP